MLTKPDRERGEGDHMWPEFLPGGKAVLFTITAGDRWSIDNAQIAVLDLRTGTSKVLIRGGSHAHYVPTGHLVYGVAGTLRAVAFDLGRLEVVGTPAPVLDGVVTTASGAADVASGRQRVARLRPRWRRWRWPADSRVGGSAGTCLTAAWPPAGLVPRRPRVARRRRGSHSPREAISGSTISPARTLSRLDDRPGAGRAARSGRPTGSASSLRRTERATRNCSGGRRMAPAATSGSWRVRKIFSICARRLVARWQTAPVYRGVTERRERDWQIAIERPSDAKVLVKALQQRLRGRVSGRTLDGLPVEYVRSIRDLRRAVSGARKSTADLDGRRPSPPLVA